MQRRFHRRLSAIVALAVTLVSLAMPAAAAPVRLPHGDLCVGGKLVPAAPAPVVHDCEACCASTPTALPGTDVGPIFVPFVHVVVVDLVAPAAANARMLAAQARAPPVS